MKSISILFFALTVFTLKAEEVVPEYVELEGRFLFKMEDDSGQLNLESLINSASELDSASSCTLQIAANDDYYNTYPIEFSLITVDDQVVPFILAKSMYIDENTKYWNRTIESISFSVANLSANDRTWRKDYIKGSYVLIGPTLETGLLTFHHLTMGQPLKIELSRQDKPTEVTINVPPLTSKVASFARKCMKLIDPNG